MRRIQPHLAGLIRSCFSWTGVWRDRGDFSLEPVSEHLPKLTHSSIGLAVDDGYTVVLYLDEDPAAPTIAVLLATKGEDAFVIDTGFGKGHYDVCMARLKKRAEERLRPWSYGTADGRFSLAIAGLSLMMALAAPVMLYIFGRVPLSASDTVFIGAIVVFGIGIALFALFGLPRIYKERADQVRRNLTLLTE